MWEPFLRGVSFYDYSKVMSHWKIALDVDSEEIFYGSYNLNCRSALHDFELNVAVKNSQLAAKVKGILEADIVDSIKINSKKEFYKYPKLHISCYKEDSLGFFQ